jgi:N-dimethylarginine dimethylaminohydrolase
VNVTHEWGKLKEVIVGRQEGLAFASMNEVNDEALQVAPQETIELFPKIAGKSQQDVDPRSYEQAIGQYDQLVSLLKKQGIVVHRPKIFDDHERKFLSEVTTHNQQQFCRDPILIVGNHIIETSLRQPWRNRERFGFRPMIDQFIKEERDFHFVSMPITPPLPWKDTVGEKFPYPILAGGDTFVFGKDILVGWSGNDTTPEGIEWLRRYISDFGFHVHEIRISQRFLHLDDGLATPREGLAIICPDQYEFGLPELLKDWEFINVTEREAKDLLAGNGLVLGPNEMLIDARLPHIAEQLDKKGVKVHTLNINKITEWAGGFRCSHHPIIREV